MPQHITGKLATDVTVVAFRLAQIMILAIVTLLQVAAQPVAAQKLSDSDAGYIDGAMLAHQIRFRFDAAYDNPVPDRAEFFYPQIGVGPPQPESRVDYQELEAYFEYVLEYRFSAFAEIPVRFINPEQNANAAGLSDVRAGFKYALIDAPDHGLTFQLRGYFPSGDASSGLGTRHVSLEPGLLCQINNDRYRVFGELKAWVPIGGSVSNDADFTGRQFSGNVLRYGLGLSYDVYQEHCLCDCCDESCHTPVGNRLSFVNEFVGWTILDGLKTIPLSNEAESAVNDTIVNLKIGLRWTTPRDSIYVGYGRALTGDVWYQDLLRAEYAIRF